MHVQFNTVSSKLLVEDFPTLDFQGGNCQKDRPTVQYTVGSGTLVGWRGWRGGMFWSGAMALL